MNWKKEEPDSGLSSTSPAPPPKLPPLAICSRSQNSLPTPSSSSWRNRLPKVERPGVVARAFGTLDHALNPRVSWRDSQRVLRR